MTYISMDIIDAMKLRRSVRRYSGRPLTPEQTRELLRAVEESESPFGGKVTIRLKSYDLKEGFRPSTYGMIRGATDFFTVALTEGDEASALSAGYRFEQVVLKACQMGLGTCWIAATFKGTDFERGQTWPEGERLRIVCPVGEPASDSLADRLMRAAMGSKNRKPFGKLFFAGDFTTPYTPAGITGEALEMLRVAPSSTNSQPWRAVVSGRDVHFYYVPKSQLAVIDCGIALSHFAATLRHRGASFSFARDESAPQPPAPLRYLTSAHLC